jgi:hypothetical protein
MAKHEQQKGVLDAIKVYETSHPLKTPIEPTSFAETV